MIQTRASRNKSGDRMQHQILIYANSTVLRRSCRMLRLLFCWSSVSDFGRNRLSLTIGSSCNQIPSESVFSVRYILDNRVTFFMKLFFFYMQATTSHNMYNSSKQLCSIAINSLKCFVASVGCIFSSKCTASSSRINIRTYRLYDYTARRLVIIVVPYTPGSRASRVHNGISNILRLSVF